MADIRNDRDITLQTAAKRTVPVVDPGAIIIEGYTGITLTKSPSLFVITFGPAYFARAMGTAGESGDRMILTARLQGIPQGTPVTWRSGGYVERSRGNPPRPYTATDPPVFDFVEGAGSVILTATGDPLVRTIEASSYPYTPGRYTSGQIPSGVVEVSVDYGGQNFKAYQSVSTFTG